MSRGPFPRFLLKFVQVPMHFLRSWVGMLKGMGLRNALIVGLVRSLSSKFFMSVHDMIPRVKIFWTICIKFLLRELSSSQSQQHFRQSFVLLK